MHAFVHMCVMIKHAIKTILKQASNARLKKYRRTTTIITTTSGSDIVIMNDSSYVQSKRPADSRDD